MEQLRTLFGYIWRALPLAGLANEYHPCNEGGVIPIPFIQAQKTVIDSLAAQVNQTPTQAPPTLEAPVLESPQRSFTQYIQGHSSLPVRDRALVCLRSAHLCHARHLLPALIAMAMDHGLRPSDIQLVSQGRFAPGWSRWEHTLICATDELFKRQSVSPKLWRTLNRNYHSGQIFDLVVCSAAFHLCTLF